MKNKQSGFSIVELSMILAVVGILFLSGFIFFRHQNSPNIAAINTYKSTSGSTMVDSTNWKVVKFSNSNLKFKAPQNLDFKMPIELAANKHGSSYGEYVTKLDNGFTMQVEYISNTSPNQTNVFGRGSPATKVDKFETQNQILYLLHASLGVADDYLYLSSCPDKVCSLVSSTNKDYGFLIFANYYGYKTNSKTDLTNNIQFDNPYLPTVKKILESATF